MTIQSLPPPPYRRPLTDLDLIELISADEETQCGIHSTRRAWCACPTVWSVTAPIRALVDELASEAAR